MVTVNEVTKATHALQGPDGTVQLQSAGLLLPDEALRWLSPLPRPLMTPQTATGPQQQALNAALPPATAADTVMQDAQTQHAQQPQQQGQDQPGSERPQEAFQQDRAQQQASTDALHTQHPTNASTADAAQCGPSLMDIDTPQQMLSTQASPQLQIDSAGTFKAAVPVDQQQPTAALQVQPQMMSCPAELQDIVHDSVVRCDRQLLGRQEAIMVRLVQHNVEEEVRQVQGPQDMDDSRVELVQTVSNTTYSSVFPDMYFACRAGCIDTLTHCRPLYKKVVV